MQSMELKDLPVQELYMRRFCCSCMSFFDGYNASLNNADEMAWIGGEGKPYYIKTFITAATIENMFDVVENHSYKVAVYIFSNQEKKDEFIRRVDPQAYALKEDHAEEYYSLITDNKNESR